MTDYHIPSLLADLQDVIMGSTLVKCAATDLGIQWAGWALAAAFKTEKFYDLAGNVETLASTSLRELICGHVLTIFVQHNLLFSTIN